ncbi:MAG: hypothetical protein V3W11_02265 [bacterium]
MTLALAGIFKDSIILGADTLTTAENREAGDARYELSHKIEPVLGKWALMFAGPKYFIVSEGDAHSINFIVRDLFKEALPTVKPIEAFDRISDFLATAWRKTSEKVSNLAPFESFFLGYEDSKSFYWSFLISSERGSEKEFYNDKDCHALVWCGGLETFNKPNYGSAYYAGLSFREGRKLIRGILNDTYREEIKRIQRPRINNKYDIGVITPEGFYWDLYQPLKETHLHSEAVKNIGEVEKANRPSE